MSNDKFPYFIIFFLLGAILAPYMPPSLGMFILCAFYVIFFSTVAIIFFSALLYKFIKYMNNFYTWSNMEDRRIKRYQIKTSILSKIFGAAYKQKPYVPMTKFGGKYQHQTGKAALITFIIGTIAMIPAIMLIAHFQ